MSGIRFARRDGSTGLATGKLYVLAAHAMETPRLLLASADENAPNGVANSSDQVGRNLMDHPSQLSWAWTKDPVWPYRGPLSTSGVENLGVGPFRAERGAFRIEIGNDGHSWPTGAPLTTAKELIAKGLRGAELDRAARRRPAGAAPYPPGVAGADPRRRPGRRPGALLHRGLPFRRA